MEQSDLRFPWKRKELIAFLDEIVALVDPPSRKKDSRDIDEIVHFFFDDTDLFPHANAEIGTFLKDNNEADAIRELLTSLNGIIHELGDVSTRRYAEHPDWKDIEEKARIALNLIGKRP